MATLIKTKSGDYDVEELLKEINENAAIVPSCMSVTGEGDDLTLEFAANLSEDEEAELDTVILNHVPARS